MSEEIRLRKVGDQPDNQLPRGVIPMIVGRDVIFVKRVAGRMMPVSSDEQRRLKDKHVIE